MRLGTLLAAVVVLASCFNAAPAHAISYRPPVRPSLPTAAVTHGTVAEITVACGSEDALGCSDGEHVWLGPDAGRWTRAHEFGHVADAQAMSDQERAAFLKLMPLVGHIEPDAGWWGYDEDGAYFYGAAEVFADAYASCRLERLPQPRPNRQGVIVGTWEGSYGYDPDTNGRQRRICARIARWVKSPRLAS